MTGWIKLDFTKKIIKIKLNRSNLIELDREFEQNRPESTREYRS